MEARTPHSIFLVKESILWGHIIWKSVRIPDYVCFIDSKVVTASEESYVFKIYVLIKILAPLPEI